MRGSAAGSVDGECGREGVCLEPTDLAVLRPSSATHLSDWAINTRGGALAGDQLVGELSVHQKFAGSILGCGTYGRQPVHGSYINDPLSRPLKSI